MGGCFVRPGAGGGAPAACRTCRSFEASAHLLIQVGSEREALDEGARFLGLAEAAERFADEIAWGD